MTTSLSERAAAKGPRPSEEQVQPNFRQRIVTDEDLSKALAWLRDNAKDLGDAKARLIRAERMLSHTEALLMRMSDATSDTKKKIDARTDQRWIDAAMEEALAAGDFEKMRALRDAAALKIEAWRSEQATYRSMRI
jgi:hypothetical protein